HPRYAQPGPRRPVDYSQTVETKLAEPAAIEFHDDRARRRSVISPARLAQSTATCAALMIGHHLAISAFCHSPSASGVDLSAGGICNPRFSRFLRVCGSFSASSAAALTLAMISFGVPFGAHSPDHSVMWKFGRPASSTVGMSPACSTRLESVTA